MYACQPTNYEIKCPFCDKGNIKVLFYPETKRDNITNSVGGRRTRVFYTSKEKYEVKNDCPHCGASASKIEKALDTGQDYKKPDRNKILERMKNAGLPTRI